MYICFGQKSLIHTVLDTGKGCLSVTDIQIQINSVCIGMANLCVFGCFFAFGLLYMSCNTIQLNKRITIIGHTKYFRLINLDYLRELSLG